MTDRELKQHVEHALDWEPSVDATEIGVSVDEGVVTLRGDVHSYAEKQAAERMVLRVFGDRGSGAGARAEGCGRRQTARGATWTSSGSSV